MRKPYGDFRRRAARPRPIRARPATCWDEVLTMPVEVTAPDRESASALLGEAVSHFRAELVETAGSAMVVRLRPARAAPAGWVFELLALVERWLEAHDLQVATCASWKPKLRDHCSRPRAPTGRQSRLGGRRVEPMPTTDLKHLRVLIANERRDRLELLAQVVIGLGHDVIAREIYVKEVGAQTAREQPDVAIVGLGLSSEHALDLIGEIVREASCPVIALLHANDPAYIREAAKRGVFAYIIDGTPEELQSAIDITLQRFTEYHNLQGAFGRRATIEQAKGILMARHAIDADTAFEMLRDHSQHNGRKTRRRRRGDRREPSPAAAPAPGGPDPERPRGRRRPGTRPVVTGALGPARGSTFRSPSISAAFPSSPTGARRPSSTLSRRIVAVPRIDR